MKFIRFGDIKAFEQERYRRCPAIDEYNHAPPRRKGFFAFPYAFCDQWYILHHPVWAAHSPLKYLRDKNGRRFTFRDLRETETTREELLKELGLPKQPVIYDKRPSWVCIMRDPKHPPSRTGSGHLNQKFIYLRDVRGNRVLAEDIFDRDWSLGDFDGEHVFRHCEPSDIKPDLLYWLGVYERYADLPRSFARCLKEAIGYLSKRGIRIECLFAWPCYEEYEDDFLAVYKNPKIFDYNGCVWHHLRTFVPQGSVLASYGTTWVYTAMRDFERALRHANPKAYARHKASQENVKASLFGGPKCENSRYELAGMYEAFFDEEDIKKIT